MADDTSKSGIKGPAGYNGAKPSSLAAPTKIYPASSKIGHGGGHPKVSGPAESAYKSHGRNK